MNTPRFAGIHVPMWGTSSGSPFTSTSDRFLAAIPTVSDQVLLPPAFRFRNISGAQSGTRELVPQQDKVFPICIATRVRMPVCISQLEYSIFLMFRT